MAQTGDDRRIDVFRIRLDASGAPELNTKPRVSSRKLEIGQKVKRACQSRCRLQSLAQRRSVLAPASKHIQQSALLHGAIGRGEDYSIAGLFITGRQ